MKRLTSPADIKQLGTILGVWAHPDDETFTCAGLMVAAIRNGQKVVCVTATKGEAGTQDPIAWPPEKLGAVRAKEMEQACSILGIKEHFWLGYMDGECHQVSDEEGASRVLEFIHKFEPDTILTFPPDGITGHEDHRAVCRWACKAAKKSKKPVQVLCAVETKEQYDDYLKAADEKFNIYFNVDEPVVIPCDKCDVCFDVSDDLLELKVAALKAMPSQTAAMFEDTDNAWMREGLTTETFVDPNRTDISWN